MFFLRQLKSFHVNQNIMINIYSAVIESCITCSIIIWFMAASKKETISLTRAVKTASYIIGKELNGIDTIYQRRVVSPVTKIMKDELHPFCKFFKLLPSGRRLFSIQTDTNHMKNSFIPSAIRSFNSLCSH